MKKTIVICDDCEKEVSEAYKILKYDICQHCVTDRLEKSLSINVPGYDKCQECNGLGYIKEWTGIGSDYDTSKCQKCDGKKRIKKCGL